jgi:hypothetical protein
VSSVILSLALEAGTFSVGVAGDSSQYETTRSIDSFVDSVIIAGCMVDLDAALVRVIFPPLAANSFVPSIESRPLIERTSDRLLSVAMADVSGK